MSLIKILDASLNELATLPYVIDGNRTEEINGENLLSFSLLIDGTIDTYIDETAVIGYGADYFDIAYFEKVENGGRPPEVKVECEHISYRLNNTEYNKEYFTELGTPTFILSKVLEDTEFTIGTVEFTETLTYSAQEKKSRRQLLFELAYLLGGELVFDGFEISIVDQRGSVIPKDLTSGGNVTVLSKRVDKRKRDELGNPTVYYTCSLYNPIELTLGDVVILEAAKLDIDIELRIVKLIVNPYDPTQAVFEISNTLPSLEDSIYRIETSTLAKGKTYYGARISPENGFESIRSDKMARSVFNADTFAMQTGDGQGNWTNKLYFDPATGKYIFDGMLSATMIEALEAQFDVTVSNVTITNVLAAETGYIAQLTVDELLTDTKVQNYKNNDTSPIEYQHMFGKYHRFIYATTDGTQEIQATDRHGQGLYWKDEDEEVVTLEETDYPVMVYIYSEPVIFQTSATAGQVEMIFGQGDGVLSNSSKGFIRKVPTGLEIIYYTSNTGVERKIVLDDSGIIINGLRYELTALNIASDSFQASYGDVVQNATLIKDVDGNITSIISGGVTIPISYNEV